MGFSISFMRVRDGQVVDGDREEAGRFLRERGLRLDGRHDSSASSGDPTGVASQWVVGQTFPSMGAMGPNGQLPTLSATEIASDRLLLRKAVDSDREGLVEIQTDPQIRMYLGGPRLRDAVEQYLDAVGVANATGNPGTYVIADKTTDRLLGTLMLDHRPVDRPGHVTEDANELELSYVLRRWVWGGGLAFEAAWAALHTAAEELPDQPVLIVTQTAYERSLRLATRLGFQRVRTFKEFDAEQTLCVASLHSFKA